MNNSARRVDESDTLNQESTAFLDMSELEEEDVTLSPIKDNDEVFLIKVPKGYDVEKLERIGEYSPPGITQIEAKEKKRGLVSVLELGAFGGKDLDLNLLINSENNKVTAGPSVNQSLCVSRSVHLNPSVTMKSVDRSAPGPVLMPSGLKPRFTPFGAGCPVPIKLKKHKKHKAKKRERVEASDALLNNNDTSISGSDTSNTIYHLFGEKRPSAPESDVMRLSKSISETSHSSDKKKKKRKSELDDFVEHDSHVNQNSSNVMESSGKEVKSFISANHKKKKKRKSEPIDASQLSLMPSNSHEKLTVNSFVSSHKKKKKKKSEADDQVFQDTSTDLLSVNVRDRTSSELENTHYLNDKEKKRAHKRKLSSGYQSLESSIALEKSFSIDLPSFTEKNHKKKRRRKEHDT